MTLEDVLNSTLFYLAQMNTSQRVSFLKTVKAAKRQLDIEYPLGMPVVPIADTPTEEAPAEKA